MQDFDERYADANTHEIIVDPVLEKKSNSTKSNSQEEADEVTPSHKFYHPFLHFFEQIKNFI